MPFVRMVARMNHDAGPDPGYVFGAWTGDSELAATPDYQAWARSRAFSYAGKYLADDGPVPPTDPDIVAMMSRCTKSDVRWIADTRQAIAMLPYLDAAGAIGRAIHRVACRNPRQGAWCRCGSGPNPYGPWRA